MEQHNRIALLSEAEINDFYAMPSFDRPAQKEYFSLSRAEQNIASRCRNVKSKIYFILQLGYFRAGRNFYDFNFEDVQTDVSYVLKTYFHRQAVSISGKVSRPVLTQQRLDILQLMSYQMCSSALIPQVEAHLLELLRYFPKGSDTLRELIGYFEAQKIVMPGYRTLQDLFTKCFAQESERLNLIMANISPEIIEGLNAIIQNENGISQLSLSKIDQRDFRYTAIKQEVEKANTLKPLYQFAKTLIPTLKLSKNAVRYYAKLIEQYPASRLRRLNKQQQYLHLICFVYHRYQQFMDNLICSFMVRMKQIMAKGTEYAGEQSAQHNAAIVAEFSRVAEFLKWFSSDEQNPETNYQEFSQAAFSILPKEQFPIIADFMSGRTFDKEAACWDF